MIYLFSILILLLALGIAKILKNRSQEKEYEKFRKEVHAFKEEADSIQVDLNQMRIKSNEWQDEQVINHSKYGGANQLIGRGDLNIKKVQRSINVLETSVTYKGQTIHVLSRVSMEPTTLKMKLAIQKETTLYVNPDQPEEYHLDLDFLKS